MTHRFNLCILLMQTIHFSRAFLGWRDVHVHVPSSPITFHKEQMIMAPQIQLFMASMSQPDRHSPENKDISNVGRIISMSTHKLTTASGKPICRYALGGAARSTQPESLPCHYRDLLLPKLRDFEIEGEEYEVEGVGNAGAPFYFYYNPHRYPEFLSGVSKSFEQNQSSNHQHHRKNIFIASGSSDRSPEALDQRLKDALVYSGGEYLDAFVLEYVCPEELEIITRHDNNSSLGSQHEKIPTNAKLGSELEGAIQHVRSYVASGKVRYVIASTHSHLVGAALASASIPTNKKESGKDHSSKKHIPALDALMLRYNLSHRIAAESLSLPNALQFDIPVLAFTTTRWNRLQNGHPFDSKENDKSPSSSDCIKFALRHPAVEIVLHSARDEVELEESLLPLLDLVSNDGSEWLADVEYDRLLSYGSNELGWNDDGFDEYPEEFEL